MKRTFPLRVVRAFVLSTFFLFFLDFSVLAQSFFTDAAIKTSSLGELEKTFKDWSKNNDLKKIKGWKYYKRWEAFETQRLNPDGSKADPRIYFSEALKFSANKPNQKANRTTGIGWLPVGPNTLPTSYNPNASYGMGRINCVAFHPTDTNTLFVGVAQGGVWKSTNSGKSWTPLTDDLPITRINDIAIDTQNPNTMYISVGDYAYLGFDIQYNDKKRNTHYGMGVFKTTDGGATWSQTGLAFSLTNYESSLILKVLINPVNTQELVAAGVQGTWHSTDGGATWTKTYSQLMWDMQMSHQTPGTIYAATGFVATMHQGKAGVIKSTDFGLTWTVLNTGIPDSAAQRVAIAISQQNDSYIYAIACAADYSFYGFYRSIDGGQTWQTRFDQSAGKNILAYSNGKTESGGQGSYDLDIIVDPQNKDKVYIGGINLWGTADGGATWDGISYWINNVYNVNNYLHADQHYLAYNPLSSCFYACNDGGIYRTRQMRIGSWDSTAISGNYQFPTKWEFIGSGMQSTSFYRLSLGSGTPTPVMAGAQDNSTFYFNGTDWYNVIGGDGMECLISPDDPNSLIGSSQYGNLSKSTDGGFSFSPCSPNPGQGEWTTPFVLHKTTPQTLFAGLGDVYASNDFASTWNPISSFAPMHNGGFTAPTSALAVTEADINYVYVAKRPYHAYNQLSEVYMTNNGGSSWNNITAGLPDSLYFTYMIADANNAQKAWITCSGFKAGAKVYETSNGGQAWKNLSYNLPNLPVNSIVQHNYSTGKYTLYVATDLGVYYLHNGSTQWLPYSNLLPNVIVTELEIHSATGKLYASTFGRGIWKTDLVDSTSSGIATNSLEISPKFSLSPSPNNGNFIVEINSPKPLSGKLEIIDIMGRKVYSEFVQTSGNNWKKSLSLDFSPGMYFATFSIGPHAQVQRFVIE